MFHFRKSKSNRTVKIMPEIFSFRKTLHTCSDFLTVNFKARGVGACNRESHIRTLFIQNTCAWVKIFTFYLSWNTPLSLKNVSNNYNKITSTHVASCSSSLPVMLLWAQCVESLSQKDRSRRLNSFNACLVSRECTWVWWCITQSHLWLQF